MKSLDILKEKLQGDLTEYKSIPFWSWNNSLDEKELVKQIEDMYSAGIGGFIMHARIYGRISVRTLRFGENYPYRRIRRKAIPL